MSKDNIQAVMVELNHIKQEITEIKESIKDMKNSCIQRVEFSPIEKLVYGLVGLILVAFGTAIVKGVFK